MAVKIKWVAEELAESVWRLLMTEREDYPLKVVGYSGSKRGTTKKQDS